MHVFLGVHFAKAQERCLSAKWPDWAIAPLFRDLPAAHVDSCLFYFTFMSEFHRNLYKSYFMFLKWFFKLASWLTKEWKDVLRCCHLQQQLEIKDPEPYVQLPEGQTWPRDPTRRCLKGLYSSAAECMYAMPYLWQHMPASLIIPGLIQTSE